MKINIKINMKKIKKRIASDAKKAIRKIKAFFRGFSLVELIVVIAVIGVLSAIIMPAFTGQLGKAKNERVKADVTQITKKLILYYIENFGFPGENEWPETAGANYGFNASSSSDAFIAYGLLPNGCCFAKDSAGDSGSFQDCPGPNDYSIGSADLFPCAS